MLVFATGGTLRRIFGPIFNLFAGKEKLRPSAISEQIVTILEARMDLIRASREMGESVTTVTGTRQTRAKPCELNNLKSLMKAHSRSQQGEDAHLVENFFKGLCGGVYVELGALDGVRFSNSYFFRHAMAWNGALIEPNTRSFKMLKQNRSPQDDVFNNAVCASTQEVHFLDDGRNGAISGVVEFMTLSYAKKWHGKTTSNAALRKIRCEPLSKILSQSDTVSTAGHVDFLSIDVEGGEFEVIKTLDFDLHQFGVILYEADEHSPVKNEAVKSFLARRGYPFVRHYQNTNYHVNEKWEEIYGNLLSKRRL